MHGILDTVYFMSAFAVPNDNSLFIGNTPSEIDGIYYKYLTLFDRMLSSSICGWVF